jgi:5-formyltetrahydrofolate cyclo-ligase
VGVTAISQAKQAVRERVWNRLEASGAVPHGVTGHIPAFYDAQAAAQRLTALPLWSAANVVKAVPDRPQQPVRQKALADGKVLYMAVPKLAQPLPFYLLDPARPEILPADASTKEGAARHGEPIGLDRMQPIDVIVTGCVAVNSDGARLGKGAGYSDIEVALLQEAGLLSDRTIIATTVHQLQVVDGPIPETDHDFRVDIIATPQEVIICSSPHRPIGVDWAALDAAKIAAIPVLAQLARGRR